MAQKTTNYNLHKIDLTDAPPDITVLNPNFDTIDKELKRLGEESLSSVPQAVDDANIPAVKGVHLNYFKYTSTNTPSAQGLTRSAEGYLITSFNGGANSYGQQIAYCSGLDTPFVRQYVKGVWSEWKQLATTDKAILVAPTGLARTESTTTRAVYTVSHDITHKTTYHFSTGASPSGTVETIIFRTPQGDYTLKIADTNVVDTMSNATWSDFNAGLDVFVYFTEKDTVKAAVITQASYGTVQKKITDNVKKINNSDNWNAGNTKPKDYINLFKPNGARKCTDLGLPATAGYWTSVLGINNYNGDTGVTEVALTDKQNIFFRTQVGTSKMENWNGANWKELATTDNAMVRYNLGSKEILNDTNHRKPYTTTIIGSVAQEIGLPLEYYNIIYQPNVQSNGYGTQIAIQMNSGKMFSRGSSGSVWNAWKELVTTDILKPVLLANGVFRRGDTITLSQSVSNFSKLLVMSGDAGGTPYPLNTNIFVGFNYPSTISSSQDVIYAGSHSTGIIKFTTKSGGTQVVLNELTGGYVRKIYGYVEGV